MIKRLPLYILLSILVLSCTGCDIPKPGAKTAEETAATQEEAQAQQVQYINEVLNSIEKTRNETNYTTTTNVTSESSMSAEDHMVTKKVDIISQHKATAGIPNIKQITNEFIYSNDSLYIKNSWLSYKADNQLGVEKQDKRIKWESSLDNANVNYANVADKMIEVTADNVADITCTPEGRNLVYIITFKPDVTYDINPIAVEYNTDNTITRAKLRVVVNQTTGLLSQTTFVTDYVNDAVVRVKNGMLHNSSLFEQYPVKSAAITERTDTVYSDFGNTSFAVPDLSKFTAGTPRDFYETVDTSESENAQMLDTWVGEDPDGQKTNILWD